MTAYANVLTYRVTQMDHPVQEVPTNKGKTDQREVGRKEVNCAKRVLSITMGAVPQAE